MLETLRRGFAKFLVFAMLSILVLSFAIWGIGDIVRQGGQGAIATVGGVDIAPREFTQALQNRRQAFQRQFGQPLTPEQSRALGVDAAVLSELVNGVAVSNHARELGIRLSDAAVAEMIRSDPSFHGPDNTFSRAVFDERIRSAGFTEQRYFSERRENEAREQVTEALLRGVTLPDALINMTHRFREETRTAAFIRLDPAKVPKTADPDEKALNALYEEQKRTFSVPERRRISVLLITPEELAERSKVTDAEARSAWEQSRASWDLPERRRIQQIQFKTRPEAEGEAKALAEGKSFLMAALEANGAQGRLDQGLVARREISDANFAKTAFELPINKISEPIQVRGGWIVMRVTEIEPARQRTFDEVKEDVRHGLEETRRREIAGKLHDEIEDKRGASTDTDKLKAIAAEMKLKLIEVEAVDARGNRPDGKPAIDHPDAERILASAFEGDKTTPREVLQLTGGGEAWVEVIDVTPEKIKPFSEVKAEVEKLWRDREMRRALAKEGQTLADRIKAGTPLETIAKELGASVETTQPFKRTAPPEGLSPGAARVAFTLAKGGAGTGALADDKGRAVLVVTDIKVPEAPTKEQADALRRELTTDLQRDTMQSYVAALRSRQKVTVNEAVYKQAVGLDQPQ
ncbi:MAG: SurA N-terminal domain-containing protein [Hyphomicrobiaceae bacterium]|nr:SurA N-terminal domain-containing protein [Hyphomicrobiaceae bacterium]